MSKQKGNLPGKRLFPEIRVVRVELKIEEVVTSLEAKEFGDKLRKLILENFETVKAVSSEVTIIRSYDAKGKDERNLR